MPNELQPTAGVPEEEQLRARPTAEDEVAPAVPAAPDPTADVAPTAPAAGRRQTTPPHKKTEGRRKTDTGFTAKKTPAQVNDETFSRIAWIEREKQKDARYYGLLELACLTAVGAVYNAVPEAWRLKAAAACFLTGLFGYWKRTRPLTDPPRGHTLAFLWLSALFFWWCFVCRKSDWRTNGQHLACAVFLPYWRDERRASGQLLKERPDQGRLVAVYWAGAGSGILRSIIAPAGTGYAWTCLSDLKAGVFDLRDDALMADLFDADTIQLLKNAGIQTKGVWPITVPGPRVVGCFSIESTSTVDDLKWVDKDKHVRQDLLRSLTPLLSRVSKTIEKFHRPA